MSKGKSAKVDKPKRESKVVTAEMWEQAKKAWEVDPTMTLEQAGAIIGVTKQSASRKARADGWKKLVTNEEMVRKAHEAADVSTAGLQIAQPPKGVSSAETVPVENAEQAAIEVRARIITKHRREWDGVRNNIYRAIQMKDVGDAMAKAKLAKVTAEALKLTQDGERKAWGLDAEEKPSVVVIERK